MLWMRPVRYFWRWNLWKIVGRSILYYYYDVIYYFYLLLLFSLCIMVDNPNIRHTC